MYVDFILKPNRNIIVDFEINQSTGGGVTKEYVDQQDLKTLNESKQYTDNELSNLYNFSKEAIVEKDFETIQDVILWTSNPINMEKVREGTIFRVLEDTSPDFKAVKNELTGLFEAKALEPLHAEKVEFEGGNVNDALISLQNNKQDIGNYANIEYVNTQDNTLQSNINTVEAIARGKSRARVFATLIDLDNWLEIPVNVADLQIGDNFYIEDLGVPDYWWNGTNKQPLEAEKVDLSDYYKKLETDVLINGRMKFRDNWGANPTEPYMKNDVVRYSGVIGIYFISLKDNNTSPLPSYNSVGDTNWKNLNYGTVAVYANNNTNRIQIAGQTSFGTTLSQLVKNNNVFIENDSTLYDIRGQVASNSALTSGLSTKLEASNIKAGSNVTITTNGNDVTINSTGGGGGTSDYNGLTNKPQINNVELIGNKSLDDIGLGNINTVYTTTGTANNYALTIPNVTSYDQLIDKPLYVKFNLTSTSATVNINVNGLGPVRLYSYGTNSVASGYIRSTQIISIIYDGSSFKYIDSIEYAKLGTNTVAYGGTGRVSHTINSLIAGGTTTSSAQQSIPNGNTGELLVSTGTSTLPTWSSIESLGLARNFFMLGGTPPSSNLVQNQYFKAVLTDTIKLPATNPIYTISADKTEITVNKTGILKLERIVNLNSALNQSQSDFTILEARINGIAADNLNKERFSGFRTHFHGVFILNVKAGDVISIWVQNNQDANLSYLNAKTILEFVE